MNKRLAISLAAFVGWLLITVVGGQIHTGKGQLTEAVTRGLGWPFLLAALFLLALIVWQQWRDVGLNQIPSGRSLLLTWLPMLYIVVGLGLAVVFGLPPVEADWVVPRCSREVFMGSYSKASRTAGGIRAPGTAKSWVTVAFSKSAR